MESYDILVIILSVTLAVSLVVWVMVGILFVQVLRKIKIASDTAQQAVDNIEQLTEQLKKAGQATVVGTILAQVKNAFKGRK